LTVGGETYPPGAFVVSARGTTAGTLDAMARELGLTIRATSAVSVKTSKLNAPRIGLYQSWTASMDEGWTRWLLEQFEFPYATIHDAEMRAGSLRQSFDVIVIPSMSTSQIVEGNRLGTMPPQYVGGIGAAGVRNIQEFVEGGGTLVVLNNGASFAIEKLGLGVTDALKDLRAPRRREAAEAKPVEFACPGSVLRMKFDTTHPVAFGMPAEAPGMFVDSPTFGSEPMTAQAIVTYPSSNLLMSGYLKGEKYLTGKVAAVDVSLGKGRVVLLGFGVQQRGQPYGTFKVLFNALYYAGLQAETTPAKGKKGATKP